MLVGCRCIRYRPLKMTPNWPSTARRPSMPMAALTLTAFAFVLAPPRVHKEPRTTRKPARQPRAGSPGSHRW